MTRTTLALSLFLLTFVLAGGASAQQAAGTIKGQIKDPSGASIPAATVTASSAKGAARTAQTDVSGSYVLTGLTPGNYTITATAPGFAQYKSEPVEVTANGTATLDFSMSVTLEEQKVTVAAEGAPTVSTEASNNAGQLVLKGADLDALPDDPDDLAADLQALAGPSAGPNGGQIYVDGFSNAQLPPKASIREIRINQNPFSAEYDRLGFGRIEILTKPGTDQFHGQAFLNAGDAIFNSRNPFAPNKPDFRSEQYGGNLSGPINSRASFFFNAERRDITDNAIIDATVVDPTSFAIRPYQLAVLTPQHRTSISPRIDYQINQNNTLMMRYTWTHSGQQNAGVGQFSLPEQAYNTFNTQQTVQLTETAVLNPKMINETRVQFGRSSRDQNADNTLPSIRVNDAFNGGGSQVGMSYSNQDNWEIQNYTSMALGAHAIKVGVRLRTAVINDFAPQNYGGTFTFTSLARYQLTLQLLAQGYTPAEVAAMGGGASQFSINAGTPDARVRQTDWGPFFQDDWRVRPNLTLSLGLRYEGQTNMHDWSDFAPRLGFAWAPGGNSHNNGKTVIRGGAGVFYDRLSENLVLQALRLNGVRQQDYVVTNPDFYPNIPPLSTLTAQPQSIYQVASNVRAPMIMQAALGVERQLPWNTTIASTFTFTHADHLLLARDINAPLPGTYDPSVPGSGVRPYGIGQNIFEYESAGLMNQKQWITNVNTRFSRNVSMFAFYVLGYANSNSDGAGASPSNPYNLAADYGRSSIDIRHRFTMMGNFTTWHGLQISPSVMIQSGSPFNITDGRDMVGDTLFNSRPAFATDLSKPGVVITPWGALDPNPGPGEVIIPRNFGQSPGMISINARLSRTWGFGRPRGTGAMPQRGGDFGGGGGPRGGGRGGFGGMRMGGGGPRGMFGGSGGSEKRYTVTLSAQVRNLLNHTNPGGIDGNLLSPFFGQSTSLAGGYGPNSAAGNRRVELSLRFGF
jgi:hypothetical protein